MEKSFEPLLDLTDITSVRALVFSPRGKLLLLQRSETSQGNPGKWELPGGKQKEGETQIDTLRREVFQEIGVMILDYPHALEEAGSRVIKDGQKYLGRTITTYFADMPIFAPSEKVTLRPEDHQDYVWVDFEELDGKELTEDTEMILNSLNPAAQVA